jgi:hypothetical protein
MWKVYLCLGGKCILEGLLVETPAITWTLLGLCTPTNDQLNGSGGDTLKVNPTVIPMEIILPWLSKIPISLLFELWHVLFRQTYHLYIFIFSAHVLSD